MTMQFFYQLTLNHSSQLTSKFKEPSCQHFCCFSSQTGEAAGSGVCSGTSGRRCCWRLVFRWVFTSKNEKKEKKWALKEKKEKKKVIFFWKNDDNNTNDYRYLKWCLKISGTKSR